MLSVFGAVHNILHKYCFWAEFNLRFKFFVCVHSIMPGCWYILIISANKSSTEKRPRTTAQKGRSKHRMTECWRASFTQYNLEKTWGNGLVHILRGWLSDEEQVSMGVGQARWMESAGNAEQEGVFTYSGTISKYNHEPENEHNMGTLGIQVLW